MSRVTILALGSRGDLQPLLALGVGLQAAGHRVRVAAYPRFEALVSAAGLAFAPLAEGRLSEGPSTAEGRRWLTLTARRGLPAWTWLGFVQDARSVARRRLADALRACADTDLIIASHLAVLVGWQMSEHYGVPLVRTRLNLPPAVIGAAPRPVAAWVRQTAWRAVRRWLTPVRRDVGLAPPAGREPIAELDRCGVPVLYGVSPLVASPVRTLVDWTHLTGFWVLDAPLDPPPPAALSRFLADGPPPVCVGFGSMLDPAAQSSTALAVEALAIAGRRGVIIRGQYGFRGGGLPPSVFALDTISHDWLFPRCAAIVHHAAAGTAAAALHAGVPAVPVPHMADQTRWARRLHALGVAAPPIPRRRLTAERLGEAIATATGDPALSARAAALGERLRAEPGVARAVRLLSPYLSPAEGGPVPAGPASAPVIEGRPPDQEVVVQ